MRTIVSIISATVIMLVVMPLASMAQAKVRNPSSVSAEVSVRGTNKVIIIGPRETKEVWFFPSSGEVDIFIRYHTGIRVHSAFSHKGAVVQNQVFVLPEAESRRSRVAVPAPERKTNQGQKLSAQTASPTPGFTPKIPEVSGSVSTSTFSLALVDSTSYPFIVFEGDFYGAVLAPGQKTQPIVTGPGIISFKVLYDADNEGISTGKNLWQVPITGIVTQDQKTFVLKDEHLSNLQRNVTKVVFRNASPYTMVSENPEYDIEPIAPRRHSRPIRLNSGFNNISFLYTNEQGVKVRAVFEFAVSRGVPVITLNANPLGSSYGVIK